MPTPSPMPRPTPSRRRAAFLAVASTLTLCAVALTGCAASPDPHTLTVLNSATDTAEHAQNQKFFDRCGAEYGVKVRQTSVPATQVVSKALRMASSHSLTDILELDGSDLPAFAATSGLQPLEPLGVDTAGLSRGALSMGSYRGTFYGIARSVNSLALVYNTDLLTRTGVPVPRTWDQLLSAARRLTSGKTYGMAFSATPDADGVYQFLPFFWSSGGDEAHLDDLKGAAALNLWKTLISDGSASSAAVTWTQQDVNDQFLAGRAAMMVNGPWQVPALDAQTKIHWAVATIPAPTAGGSTQPPIGGTVMTVPRTGHRDRQRLAAKVLDCLNTERNQVAWGEAVNNIPTRTAAAAEYRKDNPKLAGFADAVATARSRTALVGAGWPGVQTALAQAFQSVLTGSAAPERALRRAQASVDAASK